MRVSVAVIRTALLALMLAAAGGPVPGWAVAAPSSAAAGSAMASEATSSAVDALPDAPLPMLALLQFGSGPGSVGTNQSSSSFAPTASKKVFSLPGVLAPAPVLQVCAPNASSSASARMSCAPSSSAFPQFLKSPLVSPLTPKDKFWLATRDIIDPFNLMTIVANATYYVEGNAHGIYGPGLRGITKYSGVSMTENMAGEYFGTFLVCSLAHQNPHYHREPNRSIPRRVLHTIAQVAWTQSDSGSGMFNYANFVGGIATAAVSNTFVPGPGRQGWANTAQRLALAFAISPTGNLITEFVPDLASKINLHVVIFQQMLNTVSNEEGGGPQ